MSSELNAQHQATAEALRKQEDKEARRQIDEALKEMTQTKQEDYPCSQQTALHT